MIRKFQFILLAVAVLWSPVYLAQDEAIVDELLENINGAEIKRHMFNLASDEMEGRETGMEGQKKAAQYILGEFRNMGIPPYDGETYFQEFPLKVEDSNNSSIRVNGESYGFIDDFYFFPGFNAEMITTDEMVFAGYGIEDEKYNDYAKLNVEGKIVMVLSGEPFDKKGNSIITGNEEQSKWSSDMRIKSETAQKNGARFLIVVNTNYDTYISRIKYWLETPSMRLDYGYDRGEELFPTMFISERVAENILASAKYKNISEIKAKIHKKKSPLKFSMRGDYQLDLQREVSNYTSENILAFIEGSDDSLKNELVVITAHYDHVGIIDGEIHNGADDDASGTSAALTIANAFATAKTKGYPFKRSVLVMTVAGEEKGLLGSEWYTEFPVYPLENTVCDLNIDMIGRVDESHKDDNNYVYLIGSDRISTELHEISEQVNEERFNIALDYTYNAPDDPNRFYYRSDHYNFAKNGIPVIFYFSGVHEDYHKPGDDPEKIMFDKTAKIAKLIFATAWEVANKEERLTIDQQGEIK